MARLKIDYGIDLGTTNSAICRMEKGEPKVVKIDLMDTMPSCVGFTKNHSTTTGIEAVGLLGKEINKAMRSGKFEHNAFVEFKRTMATDTRYESSHMHRKYSSEELSAEVLKRLKSCIIDETLTSVVITVPAKFTVNQKTATIEAAKLAGFEHTELLQEPIAAAMAYGLTAERKDGIWMVFDFGGGTFDAALLKVEDGIIQVFDTEGDNYLGGKNLDYAIVDEILIPYLHHNYSVDSIISNDQKKKFWREGLKGEAEKTKNQLSFKDTYSIYVDPGDIGEDEDGEEIEIDMTLSQAQVFDVMRPLFQKAVDICKDLLKRNNLNGQHLDKLILVGGPTHSPLIRQMLRDQITPNVDTSIDPMTAVATGAALYASTIDAKNAGENVKSDTVKLDIGYESTSVETTEWVSVKLPVDSICEKVFVEFVRSDNSWSSGKTEVDKSGNVIEADLIEGKPNSFTIKVYDEKGNLLPSFPEEFTIIQGTKVGAAPLPYNIGIATWNQVKKQGVFRMAKGLEKNKPLPATGVVNDLRTTSQLRPGVESDVLTIPIYQVDDFSGAEGRIASLYEYVADVIITGDDVDELIPEDALVDVTLKVDSSEQMTIEAHFLATDITVEKNLDTSKKQSVAEAEALIKKGLTDAQKSIVRLAGDGIDTSAVQAELDSVKTDAENNSEKKAVLQHLKEVLRKIDDLDNGTEWQRLEAEIRHEFERLEKAQEDLGNDRTANSVEQLRRQTDAILRSKDVSMGRDVLEQIRDLFFQLTILYQCIGLIKYHNERFGSLPWKDSSRARQLINEGLSIISNQPTTDKLRPICVQILDLLPDSVKKDSDPGGLLR